MAVPDFEAYYLAAQLQWYTQWMARALEQQWEGEDGGPDLHQLAVVMLRLGGPALYLENLG